MPRLRVLAGTSTSSLVPMTSYVNTDKAQHISSDLFDGHIAVHIKGFKDESGNVRTSEYFERDDRKDITWSVQVQGRFLQTYSADDILFGNTFDRPLKLPWGTGAALQFIKFIDPTLEHDLTSQKPWALSPLISTMPHFVHQRISLPPAMNGIDSTLPNQDKYQDTGVDPSTSRSSSEFSFEATPPFPSSKSIRDGTSQLFLASVAISDSDSSSASNSSSSLSVRSAREMSSSPKSSVAQKDSPGHKKIPSLNGKLKRKNKQAVVETLDFPSAKQRRSYFANQQHRKDIIFGPSDLITTDFCYGFMEFNPGLSLRIPGGISFDLMKHWDGQPVRFTCCERKTQEGGDPWGRLLWCVCIELVEGEDGQDEEGEDEGDGEGEDGGGWDGGDGQRNDEALEGGVD